MWREKMKNKTKQNKTKKKNERISCYFYRYPADVHPYSRICEQEYVCVFVTFDRLKI